MSNTNFLEILDEYIVKEKINSKDLFVFEKSLDFLLDLIFKRTKNSNIEATTAQKVQEIKKFDELDASLKLFIDITYNKIRYVEKKLQINVLSDLVLLYALVAEIEVEIAKYNITHKVELFKSDEINSDVKINFYYSNFDQIDFKKNLSSNFLFDINNFTEEQSRKYLIDLKLNEAGWNTADLDKVEGEYFLDNYYANPSNTGYIDYVLYDEKKRIIAIIEAKRTSVNPGEGEKQAILYADSVEEKQGTRPIIFVTNAYEIWIINDTSKVYASKREIMGFYSLDDLLRLEYQNTKFDLDDNLIIDENIINRSYQIAAANNIYNKFKLGHRSALAVMATGTGKTRVAIALVKAMLKTNLVGKVLFLVDRDELLEQAQQGNNSFKTLTPEIPTIRVLAKTANDRSCCIYFGTYNAMMNHYSKFSVGFFDLIILDESHRSIYNTYKDILDYFDALRLGLTATPLNKIHRNTYNLFSCKNGIPDAVYSYEEALNNVPPYLCKYKNLDATSQFLREGIKEVNLTDEQIRQLSEEGYNTESVKFNRKNINSTVFNKNTNEFIIETLMENGIQVDGDIGKSIIFAKNTNHANQLLNLFNELYPQYNGKLCSVIHSKINHNKVLLQEFKENDMPRIAISVDMLETGIDIPEIVNISLAKVINSETTFLQILGRGTRLCPNLFGPGEDKEEFLVIDHYGHFEKFKKYNSKNSKIKLLNIQQKYLKLLIEFISLEELDKDLENIVKNEILGILSLLDINSKPIRKQISAINFLKSEINWIDYDEGLIKKLKNQIYPILIYLNPGNKISEWNFNYKILSNIFYNKIGALEEAEKYLDLIIDELKHLNLNLKVFNEVRVSILNLINKNYLKSLDETSFVTALRNVIPYLRYKGSRIVHVSEMNVDDSNFEIEFKNTGLEKKYTKKEHREIALEDLLSEPRFNLYLNDLSKGIKYYFPEFLEKGYMVNEGERIYTFSEMKAVMSWDNTDYTSMFRKLIGINNEFLDLKISSLVDIINNESKKQFIELIKQAIIKDNGFLISSLYDVPYTNIHPEAVEGIFSEDELDKIISTLQNYTIKEE